ncbi:signal peptidase complex subunit 1 isoform X2 [Phodopus roborovskii]|uniref:signal peptidase complex subunit 1 isoform X2 n=1 Tax=Phodopus roborovskii TaxID=109678 RepID=UPI0021E4ACD1|nr:signal peptidase complex subunit 1 isoform X2 [Phodopus roborovskii]
MARGGARGCPRPPETSASGATAVAPRGSAGRPGYVRCRGPQATLHKNRLPPLCCRSSAPIMLESLSSLPTQMDYKGQKLAEQMFQGIILFSALTLPPWPIYRRHPLKWLPVQDLGTEDKKSGDRKIKRHAKNN